MSRWPWCSHCSCGLDFILPCATLFHSEFSELACTPHTWRVRTLFSPGGFCKEDKDNRGGNVVFIYLYVRVRSKTSQEMVSVFFFGNLVFWCLLPIERKQRERPRSEPKVTKLTSLAENSWAGPYLIPHPPCHTNPLRWLLGHRHCHSCSSRAGGRKSSIL